MKQETKNQIIDNIIDFDPAVGIDKQDLIHANEKIDKSLFTRASIKTSPFLKTFVSSFITVQDMKKRVKEFSEEEKLMFAIDSFVVIFKNMLTTKIFSNVKEPVLSDIAIEPLSKKEEKPKTFDEIENSIKEKRIDHFVNSMTYLADKFGTLSEKRAMKSLSEKVRNAHLTSTK